MMPRLAPATIDRQIGFTFGLLRGRITVVGNFFMWPLCELPDCLVRDDGPTPSRQSAFSARVLRSGDCLDRAGRLLPSILPS